MNIKDIQNKNINTNDMNNAVNNYGNIQNKNSKFSFYSEMTKMRNDFNKEANFNENIPQDENIEQPEELLTENEDKNLTYLQNLNTVNTGLFNLGISMDEQKDNSLDSPFSMHYDLTQITQNDINVFEKLSQKTDLAVNSVDAQNQTVNITVNNEGMNVSYRSLDVSKTLFSAIDNASKTGKPVRLDFGKDTSVILKISKDGKLSADFIPNEKAMETVLKNALPQLKAKFDEENLPYNELNYRQPKQNEQNKNNNKEGKKDE